MCRFPPKEVMSVQTMYELEFGMFQGLESHKLEFADKLVRSNKKGPPSEPSTYHRLHRTVLKKRSRGKNGYITVK